MTMHVYRLRVLAVTNAWMYEVAETPEDAIKQVEREFEDIYTFSSDHREWEIETCPMEDFAQVCKEIRRLNRKVNELECALSSKNIIIESRDKTINDLVRKLLNR